MQRDDDLIREWAAELRSGKYRQTVGTLSKIDPETGVQCFCADGVLCEIMRKRDPQHIRWTAMNKENPEFLQLDIDDDWESGTWSMAPSHFYQKAGLDSGGYSIGGSLMYAGKENHSFRSTARANDNGLSFEEIADMIERYLLIGGER